MRELLRNPRMRLYLTGQLFSLFGDTMLFLAMGIWVKTLTGSSAAAGLTFLFLAAPALLAPLAGMVVDRVRRRSLLIGANLALALTVLPLLLVSDASRVWLVYTVMVGYGTGRLLISSGQAALLPTLVPEEKLGHANSALSLIQNGMRLISPLAGAGLFAASGAHTVVLIDVATFLIATATLLAIRVAEPRPAPRVGSWRDEVSGGARFIRATPELRQLVLALVIGFAVVGLIETVSFAVVAALGRPPAFLGVLVSVQGVGAVLAGVSAPRLMRRVGEGRLAAGGLLVSATGIASLAVPITAVDLAGMAVLGAGITAVAIGTNTSLQRRTPTQLLGRVDAAAEVTITVPQTVFIGVGAALVATVNYQLLIGATTALMLGSGIWLLTRQSQPSATASAPLTSGDGRPGRGSRSRIHARPDRAGPADPAGQ